SRPLASRASPMRAKATVPSRNCKARRAQASAAAALAASRAARLSCQNQAAAPARQRRASVVQSNIARWSEIAGQAYEHSLVEFDLNRSDRVVPQWTRKLRVGPEV